MLNFQTQYNSSKIYFGNKRAKEIWLGNKKIFGATARNLPQLSASSYLTYGICLENFRLMTTDGDIIAEDVIKAVGSEISDGLGSVDPIFFIQQGTLKLYTIFCRVGNDDGTIVETELETLDSGWIDITDLYVFKNYWRSYVLACGIKKDRRAAFIYRGGRYEPFTYDLTEEPVVKVSSLLGLFGFTASGFPKTCVFALTYDGKVLAYEIHEYDFTEGFPYGEYPHSWKVYRTGALDIRARCYLNSSGEWRNILTDEIEEPYI